MEEKYEIYIFLYTFKYIYIYFAYVVLHTEIVLS